MLSESLRERRSIYGLNKDLPLSEEQISYLVEDLTELVPDAFNMKSSRLVLCFGQKHEELWKVIEESFDGQLDPQKVAAFKKAAGTVLYFIDEATVDAYKEEYPLYADNFISWAYQASGMLQISIWTALAEEGIGANIQHYNPVIDEAVRDLFQLPPSYRLVAQMPFGGIEERPDAKEKEDIKKRVHIFMD